MAYMYGDLQEHNHDTGWARLEEGGAVSMVTYTELLYTIQS